MSNSHPLLFRLYVTSQKSGQLVAAALAGTGVASEDAPLLSALDHHGPQTPTELARRLGVGASTLSYRLKALEARGVVSRAPNPGDRRSWFVDLTPEGRSRWQKIVPRFAESLRAAERRIATPHDDVAAILAEIGQAVDDELRARRTAGAGGTDDGRTAPNA